jgi:glycosyltransferase involved in cell wall biosynthesis
MDELVEVHIVTYAQKDYIGQAIESVLAQRTNFRFLIKIGDDGSRDGTQEIIYRYRDKYPDLIQVFVNRENKGPHSLDRIGIRLLKQASARYVALMDGDDYWTSPEKLQTQVDFMEARSDVFGCFHDVVTVDKEGKIIKENYYVPSRSEYGQEEALTMGGAYCTSSLLFRSVVLKGMPSWFIRSCSDYTIDLIITDYGKIAHLAKNMGAYRIHAGGIWQGNKVYSNLESTIERYRICLTNPKFRKAYGSFFKSAIRERSMKLAEHYRKEGPWHKRMKFVWYYLRYSPNLGLGFLMRKVKRLVSSKS